MFFWLAVYAVVGLWSSAGASVIADRSHTNSNVAPLLSGLIWPVLIVGAAQVMLWMGAAGLLRKAHAAAAGPTLRAGDVYYL